MRNLLLGLRFTQIIHVSQSRDRSLTVAALTPLLRQANYRQLVVARFDVGAQVGRADLAVARRQAIARRRVVLPAAVALGARLPPGDGDDVIAGRSAVLRLERADRERAVAF